jgi:hypothetical protein
MRNPSNVPCDDPCAVEGLPFLLVAELARSRKAFAPLTAGAICGSGVTLLLLSLPAARLLLLVVCPFRSGLLLLLKVMLFRVASATFLTSLFSAFSILSNTVRPFIATFSSRTGTNVTIPRSDGTLRMSAMNDWINAALRLFVDAPICEGRAWTLRI